LWLIALVTLGSAAFFSFGVTRALKAMRLRPKVDIKMVVGEQGVVKTPILPSNQWTGTALVGSELWTVRSDEALPEGAAVVVDRVEGLTLHVSGVRSLQQNEKAVDHHSLS
jgi:membrane-bound ClpP family serine protease